MSLYSVQPQPLLFSDPNQIDYREDQISLNTAMANNWNVGRLTFYQHTDNLQDIIRWSQITRGDIDCGDYANYKAIAESKTLEDALNWKHTMWQIHKMLWTGKFVGLFIKDIITGYYRLRYKAKVKESFIIRNLHIIQTKCFRMGVPIFFCLNTLDLFSRVNYFLANCDEGPKPFDTYNAHKGKFETPVVILCGIPGIGEHTARLFLDKAGSLINLCKDIFDLNRKDFVLNYSSVHGLKVKFPQMVWDAFHEDTINKNRPQVKQFLMKPIGAYVK
jgi:hypothetical protein